MSTYDYDNDKWSNDPDDDSKTFYDQVLPLVIIVVLAALALAFTLLIRYR
jgi:hypothetical protein